MFYKPAYTLCPTGWYKLVGTMPRYLSGMLFETERLAKLALAECEHVQAGGQVDADSIFALAYLHGDRSGTWVKVTEPTE